MKKSAELDPLEARPNLDFSKGVRGTYSNLFEKGTNVVILDPALLDQFPDSASVNVALHAFLALPAEIRAAAIRQSGSKAYPTEDAFDPRVGTLEKAS